MHIDGYTEDYRRQILAWQANAAKLREARASLGHSVTRERASKDPRAAESNVDRASSTTRFGLTPPSQRANANAPVPGLGPALAGAAAFAPGRSATRTVTTLANTRPPAASVTTAVPVLDPPALPQPQSTPERSRPQIAAPARSTSPTRPQRPPDIQPDAASRAVTTVSSSTPTALHLRSAPVQARMSDPVATGARRGCAQRPKKWRRWESNPRP